MDIAHGSDGVITVVVIDPESKEPRRQEEITIPTLRNRYDTDIAQHGALLKLLGGARGFQCLPIEGQDDHFLVLPHPRNMRPTQHKSWSVKGVAGVTVTGPGVILQIKEHKPFSADITADVGDTLINYH